MDILNLAFKKKGEGETHESITCVLYGRTKFAGWYPTIQNGLVKAHARLIYLSSPTLTRDYHPFSGIAS
jgi:hypothetical protein